jgi:hypothetical protein
MLSKVKSFNDEQSKDELRVFSIFYNEKIGKYRVAQADLVIVDNLVTNATFPESISAIIKSAKQAGEKIKIADIKI